jgi:HSP20 family molecular chaperone IbpA
MNSNQQGLQFTQQYQQQSQLTGQIHFSPTSSCVTNMGTTVMYSISPQSNVSAYACNTNPSGSFSNNQQNMQLNAQQASMYQGGWTQSNSNQMSQNQIGAQQMQQMQQSLIAQPGIGISETSSDVIVSAFVPNVSINDMNLNITENSVTISGSAWTGNQNLLLSRTVALPTSIRAESVDANLRSGILEIRLPKTDRNLAEKATVAQNQQNL